MNICLLCWTSSANAISDQFADLHECLQDDRHCFFAASSYSVRDTNERVLISNYGGRKRSRLFGFFSDLLTVRKYVKEKAIEHVFIFSSSPVTAAIPFVLPRKVRFSIWVHDPITHSGESRLTRVLKYISEHIWARCRRLERVFVSGVSLTSTIGQTPLKGVPAVAINLPYSNALANDSGSVKIVKKKGQIIFFGRVAPYKGLEWFIEALNANTSVFSGRAAKLLVVGRGNSRELFASLRSDLPVEIIDNYVPNPKLRDLISESELAIFPYRDATGTCAIQTAGALGCKSVCTDVGTLAEVALPENSIVVNRDDSVGFLNAINELLGREIQPYEVRQIYCRTHSPRRFAHAILKTIDPSFDTSDT